MASPNQQDLSSRQSEEDPIASLGATPSRTIREIDTQFQELKRENFDLKLRIYFLEQNDLSSIDTSVKQHPQPSQYEQREQFTIHQTGDGYDQVYHESTPGRHRPHTQTGDSQANIADDGDNRSLEDKLEKYRQENIELRQSLDLRDLDDRKRLASSSAGRSTETITTFGDSGLDTATSPMSNTLQVDLRDSKERERSLKQELSLLKSREDRLRGQLEAEVRKNEDQQAKSERVFKRLKADYEARIFDKEEEQQKKLADYESYRHEQEQISSNVNIEEYQQEISSKDRIIRELQEKMNRLSVRQPSSPAKESNDENVQRLKNQLKLQLETVDQLRVDCDELRRGEKTLRKQIDDLNRLCNPRSGSGLPPLPTSSIIDSTQKVDDPQSAVNQVTVQLRNDAETISSVSNRISQIIHERDDFQKQVKDKDTQLRQLENREIELESRIRQQADLQIEILHRKIQHSQTEIDNRDRLLAELNETVEKLQLQIDEAYKRNEIHTAQEKENLRYQVQKANEEIDRLKQELDGEEGKYDDLRRKYDDAVFEAKRVIELDNIVQRQAKEIEGYRTQLQEIETNFAQERIHLEREMNFEKQKFDELQIELNTSTKRFSELQILHDQSQMIIDEQQNKYKTQIHTHQNQIAQLEQADDNIKEEVQQLRHKVKKYENQDHEIGTEVIQLRGANDDLKGQIGLQKIRFQDSEDDNKRHRIEIAQLKRDFQDIAEQLDDRIREVNEWKRKYDITNNKITTAQNENNHIKTNYQTISEEKNKLKHEMDNLEIRIRLEINQEREIEYRNIINEVNNNNEAAIQTLQREKETVQHNLEQVNNAKARLEDQLRTAEHSLQKADEAIDNYERDIDRLRKDLNRSKEENERYERETSRAQAEELKRNKNHIQELENEIQSNRTQISLFERQIDDLRHENTQLIQNKPSYDNGRTGYVASPGTANNPELINQLQKQLNEKEELIRKLQIDISTFKRDLSTDAQLEYEDRIEQLHRDLDTKEGLINKSSRTIEEKDQQIEQLLDLIKKGDNVDTGAIEILEQQIHNRDRRIDEIVNENDLVVNERDRHITTLQIDIRHRERQLTLISDQLQLAEQTINTQQLDIDEIKQKYDRININLTIPIQDNRAHLEKIRDLEKELEMAKKINEASPSEQHQHYQSIIEDLKTKLQERNQSNENLQRSLRESDEDLKDTRQAHNRIQSDYNRAKSLHDQMEKRLSSEVDNREQLISSLRQKLSDKEQEKNKLHDTNLAKEQKINDLYSKLINSPQDPKPSNADERAPTITSLQIRLRQKDEEIHDLRQKLEKAHQTVPNRDDQTSYQSTVTMPSRRPPPNNLDNLNREELLYELAMALQQISSLNEQLAKKSPNVTEIHIQLSEVRTELERQKYVNQVLWRKLDALIDIYGSNTRAELAIELANYQDLVAKLKLDHYCTDEARSAVVNANSRSTSEQNLSTLHHGLSSSGLDLPSKNIKSTIALLERSNIEWQSKIARLTEQLGRSESQSRNYHRELIKYQKLLYEAGLIEPSVRQRRRSADDSLIISINDSNKINDDLTKISNINELKEIIRNQRKYVEQLQMRIRINAPDILQSPTIEKQFEKLNEQNRNLNLVIETYNNESNIIKNELKKLYKTIEHNRLTLQQYEKLIKEQQIYSEQSNKKLNRYEQLLKKYDIHLPSLLNEQKQHIIDPLDDFIIDLDIDIIQTNDKKKTTSSGKKDSGISISVDTNEHRQQIKEKDDEIRTLNAKLTEENQTIQRLANQFDEENHKVQRLTNQLNEKNQRIQQLTDQLEDPSNGYGKIISSRDNDSDRIIQDLTKELRETKDLLRETEDLLRRARSQLDTSKISNTHFDQVEERNQRLRAQVERLQNEIESSKPLIENYKIELTILQEKLSSYDNGTGGGMPIRTNELLEEMRLLRRYLEQSISKQNELQIKLDENIRQSRTQREFTFSGRGVSYPDLRLIDASGSIGAENVSLINMIDEKRARPVGSSSTEFEHIEYPQQLSGEIDRTIRIKPYMVGEIKVHNDLRRLIENIKFDLKATTQELKKKLRSRTSSFTTDTSIEEHLHSLDDRLTHTLDLLKTYWKAELPEKNKYDEHPFIDQRLVEENKRLILTQRKYIQDIQHLRQKHKEQANYLDQLLSQLTKANRKKADTGDYLALLLRPTLDVLQKARSNIEHHLKESNTNNIPPGSAQSHRRRHHTNRQD